MNIEKVIACRPNHIVTQIKGVKENGKYNELKKRIFNWRRFYKRKLKQFENKHIFVETYNTLTGQSFYNNFYVCKDHNGNLRLW